MKINCVNTKMKSFDFVFLLGITCTPTRTNCQKTLQSKGMSASRRKRLANQIPEVYQCYTQWNLSIADMLYSGHLVIADAFLLRLGESRSNTYKKPLYSGQFIADTRYNGHVFPRLWRQINLSIADNSEICLKQ